MQNYIMVVYELYFGGNEYVGIVDIENKLGVSKGSTSRAMISLAEQGLVSSIKANRD